MRICALLAFLAACGGTRLHPKTPYGIQRAPLTVPLSEEVETNVEITFPDHGKGPHPTVMLIHGSGPQDMDATLPREGYEPTRLFAEIADTLTGRGFAVVRYNKRHVSGPGKFDLPAFITDQSTFTFRDDAARVLDAVKAHPRVHKEKLFVYGWSEGSTVAAALAADRPDLAGVIVQGPVGMPYRELFRGWLTDSMVPYLQRFAQNDTLDGYTLGAALHSAASQPALMTSSMLAISFSRGSQVVTVSPLIDLDKDGQLSIPDEVVPRIDDLVDLAFSPLGNFVAYNDGVTLEPVQVLLKDSSVPLLVLQGNQDAHTPPVNADRIESALTKHPDITVARFAELGHTLGLASDPIDDVGRPIRTVALDVLTAWLALHAK